MSFYGVDSFLWYGNRNQIKRIRVPFQGNARTCIWEVRREPYRALATQESTQN